MRRFVSGAVDRFADYVRAAQDYPDNVTPAEAEGLYKKPFGVGLTYTTLATSQVLCVIERLRLESGALFIDAGAGSGWVTEILLGLGYRVCVVEPSPIMVAAARERVRMFEHKYHLLIADRVEFITSTVEELAPPSGRCADAVLFFEAFHHLVDEALAARVAFEQLRPGGYIAICGESRWLPGNQQQAKAWNDEMEKFGTLESPLTREYMHHVLANAGFTDIQFFHTLTTLVPVEDEVKTVREVAGNGSAEWLNTVIARRPASCRTAGGSVTGTRQPSSEPS
jgi:SAM-dependent methyltransferase